jgi:hypothetical protein
VVWSYSNKYLGKFISAYPEIVKKIDVGLNSISYYAIPPTVVLPVLTNRISDSTYGMSYGKIFNPLVG